MDIKLTLTDEEITRVAGAIRGNREILVEITDLELVTAILEEHLKNWVRSYEGKRDADTARVAAEVKVDTEVLPGKGEVVLKPVIEVTPVIEEPIV